MTAHEKEAWRDIILGIVFLLFGLVVYIASFGIPSARYDLLGAAFMPRYLGVLCVITSCGILFFGIRKKLRITQEQEIKNENAEVKNPTVHKKHPFVAFFSMVLFTLFILALDWGISGFRTLTIIFMLVLGGLLIKTSHMNKNLKHGIILVLLAVIMGFGLHYVFTQIFVVDLY